MKRSKNSPNTLLGEVHWHACEFFGTYLPICQGMLGMDGPRNTYPGYLDTKQKSVEDLWEYFEECELKNGMLGLYVFEDDLFHSMTLAMIETTVPYGTILSDQEFKNLVDDFVEHVRELPLGDLAKREGALWTDEDIERGYSEKAAHFHQEAWKTLEQALEEAAEKVNEEL